MNKIPLTSEKCLRFMLFVFEKNKESIKLDQYKCWISQLLGSNHQTNYNYLDVINKSKVFMPSTKANYLNVDYKKMLAWVVDLKNFYYRWAGWDEFEDFIAELEKKKGETK